MTVYEITLVPASQSPVIREMFAQKRQFEAASLKEAKKLTRKAFENDCTWVVENITAYGEKCD